MGRFRKRAFRLHVAKMAAKRAAPCGRNASDVQCSARRVGPKTGASVPDACHAPLAASGFRVERGSLPQAALCGMTTDAFLVAAAHRTRYTARALSSIVHPASFHKGGTMVVDAAHRDSFMIGYADLAYFRELRGPLDALTKFAMGKIVELGGHPRPSCVLTEAGPKRDASMVLYEEGGHYAWHHDAAGLRPGRRAWTFLVYLRAPSNAADASGGLAFAHETIPCSSGTYLIWRNQDGSGKADDAAAHRALPVLAGAAAEEVAPFHAPAPTPSGVRAIAAHKVAINMWFDEAP